MHGFVESRQGQFELGHLGTILQYVLEEVVPDVFGAVGAVRAVAIENSEEVPIGVATEPLVNPEGVLTYPTVAALVAGLAHVGDFDGHTARLQNTQSNVSAINLGPTRAYRDRGCSFPLQRLCPLLVGALLFTLIAALFTYAEATALLGTSLCIGAMTSPH